MATVNKNFRIKNGLIVEGATATVNGFDVLTKAQADQDYIVGIIGGTATSANTANTVVKRDANGNFAAGTITATFVGNLTGDVTGTVSSLANHDTADLAENAANKYFTDARALSATAAAYDAAGSAAAAQSAAITAAGTDATTKVAAEAALRVSGDAASVSTASADATSKANAAQAAAISTASADATSKANAAQSAAEATAAADATTKANAAQAAAISAAASDATSKANAAQSAAISAAAADATSKANAAQSAAEATAATANTAQQNGTTAFTAINYNDVAKQVAATTGNIVTAAATTAIAWAAADYRSAKLVVKVKNGVHTQVSDLVITLDTANNVAVSEYGITYSNGTELAAVTADYSGTDVRVRVTPANANTEVVVVGTLIK
jgi:hypothetical protein